jgi:hypothetical protein
MEGFMKQILISTLLFSFSLHNQASMTLTSAAQVRAIGTPKASPGQEMLYAQYVCPEWFFLAEPPKKYWQNVHDYKNHVTKSPIKTHEQLPLHVMEKGKLKNAVASIDNDLANQQRNLFLHAAKKSALALGGLALTSWFIKNIAESPDPNFSSKGKALNSLVVSSIGLMGMYPHMKSGSVYYSRGRATGKLRHIYQNKVKKPIESL